jgi:hypothetical protein
MAHIFLLALAAAVFPLLLACVAIIIARPEPRTMLLAFYIGGLLVSVTAGVLLLSVFSDHRAVLGSSSSPPSPGSSIIAGLVAVLLAWLMASQRGRAELSRWRDRHSRRRARAVDTPSWAKRHLAGASASVAFAVGAAINLPGPFYVLALGEIASGGYSSVQAFGLVLLFNVVMFTCSRCRSSDTSCGPSGLRNWWPSLRVGSMPTACGSWAGWSVPSESASSCRAWL